MIKNNKSTIDDLLLTKHGVLILSPLRNKGSKIREFGSSFNFLGLIRFLSSSSLGRHDESTIGIVEIERN